MHHTTPQHCERMVTLAAITILALVSVLASYSGGIKTAVCAENPRTLNTGAIYVRGAVVIGLVAFGTILDTGVATCVEW